MLLELPHTLLSGVADRNRLIPDCLFIISTFKTNTCLKVCIYKSTRINKHSPCGLHTLISNSLSVNVYIGALYRESFLFSIRYCAKTLNSLSMNDSKLVFIILRCVKWEIRFIIIRCLECVEYKAVNNKNPNIF